MRPHSLFVVTALLLSCSVPFASADAPQVTRVISDFDRPFLFAYGSWTGKATVEDGRAILRGFNNQGGAGFNLELDLIEHVNDTPAVMVRAGQENRAEAVRMLLRDEQGRSATWWFIVKKLQPGQRQLIFAADGASVAEPNETGEPGEMPDLSRITQVQVQGDWAGGREMDLELESLVLLKPDPGILAARQAKLERLAAQAEAQRRERAALKARFGPRHAGSPTIEHISAVAPDILAVEIMAGRVIPARLERYIPREGDARRENRNDAGEVESITLERGGQPVGWLTGPDWDWLNTFEGFEGDPLLEFLADDVANYTIVSSSGQTLRPVAVHRKSKPTDWAQGINKLPLLHTLYLRLPMPMTVAERYTIEFGEINTREESAEFMFDPARVRSPAVHVQQVGYRPDDPLKRAFVSCWLGNGARLELPEPMRFSVVEDVTGRVVFSGVSDRVWPATKPESMAIARNFNATDVARLDFSPLDAPGRYRIVVENVGTSYPFEIGPDVWRRAFWVKMKGLYNNRSGVALGPPHTEFVKPRDMHPEDGYRVTWSAHRDVDLGDHAGQKLLVQQDTGRPADGWGGYHDAGDWNPRRVTHMRVTAAQLEIFDLFPAFFESMELGIPRIQGIPDVLTEAIFEFSCFHRLQTPDGGIPYQLESAGDPSPGEVSWLNRLPTYVNAPDYRASWYYAAVGARLARLLEAYDARRAAEILDSAIRAMDFAEKDYAAAQAAGKRAAWDHVDTRNWAAIEMYRATGDARYHAIFLQDTVLSAPSVELFRWGEHVQRDAAFTYARLPEGLGDATLKARARQATIELADRALAYAERNAWGVTSTDPGKPQFLSFYSTGNDLDLARAHYLTGQRKYLAGLLQAQQFPLGCNPNNVVYTTGLGANPVRNPLKLDSRRTGQPAPIGLTVAGNIDFQKWGGQEWVSWPITWHLGPITTPHPLSWPTHEAFFDVYMFPAMTEYCVDWWAPNVFNWGYLAAR